MSIKLILVLFFIDESFSYQMTFNTSKNITKLNFNHLKGGSPIPEPFIKATGCSGVQFSILKDLVEMLKRRRCKTALKNIFPLAGIYTILSKIRIFIKIRYCRFGQNLQITILKEIVKGNFIWRVNIATDLKIGMKLPCIKLLCQVIEKNVGH